MAKCIAVKESDGKECRKQATEGNYCYSHNPANKEALKVNGGRGGRIKALRASQAGSPLSDELDEIKEQLRELLDELKSRRLPSNIVAVAVQLLNAQVRVVEEQRRVYETDVLEQRLAELEEKQQKGKVA